MSAADSPAVRLDKWLWAARFFKTRSLAKQAVEGGKVHYNNERCKVSKQVEIGATLRIRQGTDEKQVIVMQLSEQRGPASIAQTLYQETDDSLATRQQQAEQRRQLHTLAPEHKPDKKNRRKLVQFKHQQE